MKRIMSTVSQYFENVPDQLRKRKLLVWLFFIAATAFFVVGMGRTKFDTTVEGWFERDDPTLVAFDGFHAEFGSEDHLFIAYKPKDGDVFSTKSLEAVKGIRDEILNKRSKLKEGEDSALKHIVRITTLVNAPVLKAEDDTLRSGHLVEKTVPNSKEGLDGIRKTAESEKKFPLIYYSKDHKYGGIFVETDFGAIPMDSETTGSNGSKNGDELKMDDTMSKVVDDRTTKERIRFKPTDLKDYNSLMKEVKLVLNKPEYADHLQYYPVGHTAATEYDMKVLGQMGFFNLAALGIIVILLWFLFRSLSAVIWPITIVILCAIWTIGITGWLGVTVTSFVMLTIMLIVTIGVTDSVHILSGYLFFRNKGHDHKSTLRTVYRTEGVAMLLTAVTNIIGILALNITPIVPIQVFSLMSAAGIGFALFFSIYLLPTLLDLWSPKNVEKARQSRLNTVIDRYIPDFSLYFQKLLEKVFPVAQKNALGFVLIFMAVLGICVYGATKINVDTDPIGQYPKNSKMRESVAVVDRNMMGAHNLEIYMDLGKENAFKDPLVLNMMDELQHKIEKKYSNLVARTSSLADVVKDSYQKLNEGKEEKYIIPSDQQVISQTLFLFNNANPDDRKKFVSDNYSKSHISIQLHNTGSSEYEKLFSLVQKDIDESVAAIKQNYPDTKVSVTGMLALLMQAANYLVVNQLQSFVFALIAVSIVLLLVFSSFKAGLIAIVPNLIPSALTFGLMGLLNIPLDFFTMMLAPVIIGISIDDTVHFINHYRNEVLIDGDIERALRSTIKESGHAIMFTALILGLGFGIMAFSSSAGISNVGIFGSLAVITGLLNDLFLLPAIILILKFNFSKKVAVQESDVLANQYSFSEEEE